MNSKLNKNQIEKFSRQIILKNIGTFGQKKILNSKHPNLKFINSESIASLAYYLCSDEHQILLDHQLTLMEVGHLNNI